eukprot:GDKJ01059532.1.p1 GENE.GDKJ01059532.1~~GDKJ01059532.1.p1  ORF type:complete len:363 (+),score=97.14 GDKJ01059532.1:77-1165(+)
MLPLLPITINKIIQNYISDVVDPKLEASLKLNPRRFAKKTLDSSEALLENMRTAKRHYLTYKTSVLPHESSSSMEYGSFTAFVAKSCKIIVGSASPFLFLRRSAAADVHQKVISSLSSPSLTQISKEEEILRRKGEARVAMMQPPRALFFRSNLTSIYNPVHAAVMYLLAEVSERKDPILSTIKLEEGVNWNKILVSCDDATRPLHSLSTALLLSDRQLLLLSFSHDSPSKFSSNLDRLAILQYIEESLKIESVESIEVDKILTFSSRCVPVAQGADVLTFHITVSYEKEETIPARSFFSSPTLQKVKKELLFHQSVHRASLELHETTSFEFLDFLRCLSDVSKIKVPEMISDHQSPLFRYS